MLLSLRSVLLASVLSMAFGAALARGARADRGVGSIEVSFVSSATLHDFEGSAPPIPVAIETQADGTWAGEVLLPVAALDTGIRARDENLRKMLDATHHPEIRGHFRDVDAEEMRRSAVMPLLLRIREVERPVQAKLSGWQQDGDHARFDATFDVSLAAFELQAPRVLFVRVDDTVHVTVHVTLERVEPR